VVRPSGFEPLAFCSGGKRSIQLSYGRGLKTYNLLNYSFRSAPTTGLKLSRIDSVNVRNGRNIHVPKVSLSIRGGPPTLYQCSKGASENLQRSDQRVSPIGPSITGHEPLKDEPGHQLTVAGLAVE
jgi:hypothetical protein